MTYDKGIIDVSIILVWTEKKITKALTYMCIISTKINTYYMK